MKLTLITENNQILQQTAEKLNISIDELNKLLTDADPTGRKYKNYVLKLLLKQNIKLPEDTYRTREALENFIKYQRNLEVKDILKYNSLHELETTLEPYIGSVSKRQGGNNLNPSSIKGVELLGENDKYKIYKVTDAEALKDIGEGTKWCTRRSYPDCQAEYYIKKYAWIGVTYNNGKPLIQFTSNFDQIMDVNDEEIGTHESFRLILTDDYYDKMASNINNLKLTTNKFRTNQMIDAMAKQLAIAGNFNDKYIDVLSNSHGAMAIYTYYSKKRSPEYEDKSIKEIVHYMNEIDKINNGGESDNNLEHFEDKLDHIFRDGLNIYYMATGRQWNKLLEAAHSLGDLTYYKDLIRINGITNEGDGYSFNTDNMFGEKKVFVSNEELIQEGAGFKVPNVYKNIYYYSVLGHEMTFFKWLQGFNL